MNETASKSPARVDLVPLMAYLDADGTDEDVPVIFHGTAAANKKAPLRRPVG